MDKKTCIFIKDRNELRLTLKKLKEKGFTWVDNSEISPTRDSMDPEIFRTYSEPRFDLGNVLVIFDDNSVSIGDQLVVSDQDEVYDADEYI